MRHPPRRASKLFTRWVNIFRRTVGPNPPKVLPDLVQHLSVERSRRIRAMQFTLKPVGAAGAAEIIGLDSSQTLDHADLAELKAAFLRYPILAIRDQHLTPPQQARFSAQFGALINEENREFTHPEDPNVLILTNELRADGSPIGVVDAGDYFHSDSSHKPEPVLTTILYAVRNPATGGETEFANMTLLYEALPDDLRRAVEGRYAYHHVSKVNPRVAIFSEPARRPSVLRDASARTRRDAATGGPDAPGNRSPIALRLAALHASHRRHGSARVRSVAHADLLLDARSAVHLPARVARPRPRDVGQPLPQPSRDRRVCVARYPPDAPHDRARRPPLLPPHNCLSAPMCDAP